MSKNNNGNRSRSNSINNNCIDEPEVLDKEDQFIIGLEGNIKGYKMALLLLVIIILAVIILYIFNPVVIDNINDSSAFNLKSKIVYITISTIVFFICLTLLGKMFLRIKNGSSNNESINNTSNMVNIIVAVCSFIIILIIAFSNDFKKNKALSFNYLIIFLLLITSCIAYLYSTKNDYVSMSQLPKTIQMFYGDRAKYTIILIVYLFTLALLYYYDPWSIMSKYIGLTIFVSAIVALSLFVMIYLFQYYFTHPSKSGTFSDAPTFGTFMKSFYIVGALGISGLLLYALLSLLGAFNQDSYKKSELGHTVLNYLMLAGMLAIIWKLVNSGGFLENNPVFRLIFNTILYIPCLLVNVLDYFTGQYNTNKKSELIILLIALSLFIGYFVFKYAIYPFIAKTYYSQGGMSVTNDPIPTDKMDRIISYQELNTGVYEDQLSGSGSDDVKRNYNYAISFWFYLDSFSPSTSSAYNKTSNILSFGDNPAVRYNAVTNSLVVTMKYNDNCKITRKPNINKRTKVRNINTLEGFNQMRTEIKSKIEEVKAMPMSVELDEEGNVIVYVKQGVLLQKWNNVVLNYNGGTLDIFYNGELVKSAIELVPCITFDMLTVGDDNGVSGNVANVLYFNQTIDYLKVSTLYNSLNGVNPPIIPSPTPPIIQSIISYIKS
jgi:hypothetical protein